MRKFVINGDFLAFETFAGVSRFATEILRELDLLLNGWDIEILTPEYAKIFPEYQNIKIIKYGNKAIIKWKNIVLPKYVKDKDALLIDLTQAFPVGVKAVTCIHDCIPELVESAYGGFYGKCIKKPIKLIQRKKAIKSSVAILTVSDYSKCDIARIYHINADSITVINNAWQHIEKISYDNSILEKYNLDNKKFYFTLGSLVPHKNLKWIVAAAQQNRDSIFVVSGDSRYCRNFDNGEFPPNIIFTGYISDGEIRSLMAKCIAFILPSIYEGFGIPPMEALAEGVPIIISNTSCLPSIYGNSAYYIDPLNYENINLEIILSGRVGNPRDTLAKYSWKKSAEALYQLLNGLR